MSKNKKQCTPDEKREMDRLSLTIDKIRQIRQEPKRKSDKSDMPKLILLITIDCLRADHVNYYNNDKSDNSTPNIDKLAEGGVVFLNAVTNSSATRGAFPNIFYSNYQWETYDGKTGKIIKSLPCLQKSLNPWYKSISIHANPFLSRHFGWESGFSILDDSLVFRKKSKYDFVSALKWLFSRGHAFKQGSANQMFDSFMKHLTREYKGSKNLFIHLHFMDPHEPLLPPREFLKEDDGIGLSGRFKALYYAYRLLKNKLHIKKMNHEDKNLLMKLYRAEIKYSDYYVGKIIKYLEKSGFLEDSLVILTADHGQEFGEHGAYIHGRAYEEVIRVPLIFYSPRKLSHKAVDHSVQLMDIAPTILDFSGIIAPNSFKGTSLCPLLDGNDEIQRGRRTITQNAVPHVFRGSRIYWGVRGNRYKYILTQNAAMETIDEELYDIETDCMEKVNIVMRKQDIARDLRKTLRDEMPEFTKYNRKVL